MPTTEGNSNTIPAKEISELRTEPLMPTSAGQGNTDPTAQPQPQENARTETGNQTTEEGNDWLQAYEATFRNIAEGDVVEGIVIAVTGKEVIVDVGYKSEGIIPLEEFYDDNGKAQVKAGDKVSVFLEQAEDSRGHVILSHEKAKRMKVWDEIERAYRDKTIITGRVIERIKGGLAVDIGVRAFLPGSQIDLRPVRNLDSLRGEELRMKVIKVNKKRGNIVLSRKAVLEEELEKERKKTLENLEENKIVEGVIKNITDYGVFVDLGGIDGLLHITDMSWGKINHPSEMFSLGQHIRVKIIKYDREEGRVSLGHKQMTEDPWTNVAIRYPRNARVHGKVVNLTDYGAFIELEPGIEGLVHKSEMTWNKRIKHPSKIVNVGDTIDVVVLDIDSENRKISLGLKQTEPNPWELIREKYSIGAVVTGRVRNITDFGAFIEVEEGIDGLVHISDLSWTRRVKHPSEVLKKGERVTAKILEIDVENQKLSLGIKQLEPDKWDEFFNTHAIGDVVKGRVMRVTNFGIFVEVAEGVEGLCHISEVELPRAGAAGGKKSEKLEELFLPGQEVEMRIIKLNRDEKKIGLSVKALKEDDPRSEIQAYMSQSESGNVTMKDRIGAQLGEISGFKKEENS